MYTTTQKEHTCGSAHMQFPSTCTVHAWWSESHTIATMQRDWWSNKIQHLTEATPVRSQKWRYANVSCQPRKTRYVSGQKPQRQSNITTRILNIRATLHSRPDLSIDTFETKSITVVNAMHNHQELNCNNRIVPTRARFKHYANPVRNIVFSVYVPFQHVDFSPVHSEGQYSIH